MPKKRKNKDKDKKRKNKDKDKRKLKDKNKPLMAATAEPFRLYQESVQCPEAEIAFFEKVYKKRRRRRPMSMREDFCGTAFLATEWVKSDPARTAIGVDLDAPTLQWARDHVLSPEPQDVRERVTLVQGNVLNVFEPQVDILCALNFSYCCFKTRPLLRQYFSVAHQSLASRGMFFCELYGGTEAIIALEEERQLDGFSYVWEQEKYNPINRHTLCHIHFDFPDGSRLERAFTYDWRLWTIPEVRESLLEAGFSRVDVYWDPVEEDEDGLITGTGAFRQTEEEENQEGWLAYLVAHK